MNTKCMFLSLSAAMSAAAVFAGLYGDTPDARHAWAVHDMNRPNPAKVTPGAQLGQPPSDAVVLFDGTSLDNWKFDKKPWKLVDGTMESVAGAGYISTKQSFGDCQLHIEWASPSKVQGMGQGRGNSGIFLMSSYEIQVLDSFETDPANMKNPNYADGQASAVYAENPPLVNASRGPGEWQTYDIVFHQPIWDGNKMVHPGSVTVFHNGVLTQDHWEMEGLTTHCVRRPLAPHATKLPLQLQDHGNPVHFRNIWIREIPSRYANTTHGGPGVVEADVKALRHQTAEKLFAKINLNDGNRANTLNQILEVISYEKADKYLQALGTVRDAWLADIQKCDKPTLEKRKGEIFSVRGSCNVLFRNHVIDDKCTLRNAVNDIIQKNGLK
jgi:hypothetical protein